MDMQTRTGSAYAWPGEPHAIARDKVHARIKGVRLDADPYTDSAQNDESQCVVFWDAYRAAMGMPGVSWGAAAGG